MTIRRFALAAIIVALTWVTVAAAGPARVQGSPPPWTGPPIMALAWGKSPVIVFGPAGSSSGLYTIAPAGGAPHKISTTGGGDAGLSLAPDGKTLLFGSGSTIREVRSDGTGNHAVGNGLAPIWSPGGKKIMFLRGDGIYIMNADGSGSHKAVASDFVYEPPTWSPNGQKIAYVACTPAAAGMDCNQNTDSNVYVVGIDGSGLHSVTPTPGFPQCPAWSSIGRLAFLAGTHTVEIVQAAGLKKVTGDGCPAWSPNGRALASATATGVNLVDASGASPTKLTILPGSHTVFLTLAWSGNGKSLAVAGGPAAKNLYVINTDGSGLKKLF